MTSLSSQYLYRAQELFDQYRHEQRQLARAQPAPQRPVVSKPSREFWDFLYEDDATAAPAEDARALQLDRLAAALRIAVSELVGVYCELETKGYYQNKFVNALYFPMETAKN